MTSSVSHKGGRRCGSAYRHPLKDAAEDGARTPFALAASKASTGLECGWWRETEGGGDDKTGWHLRIKLDYNGRF